MKHQTSVPNEIAKNLKNLWDHFSIKYQNYEHRDLSVVIQFKPNTDWMNKMRFKVKYFVPVMHGDTSYLAGIN